MLHAIAPEGNWRLILFFRSTAIQIRVRFFREEIYRALLRYLDTHHCAIVNSMHKHDGHIGPSKDHLLSTFIGSK
jgi:hypothetical protein